jgi:hypothetical protein
MGDSKLNDWGKKKKECESFIRCEKSDEGVEREREMELG